MALLALAGIGAGVAIKAKKSSDVYRVWFGTNRNACHEDPRHYLPEIANSVHYGYCDVRIPKSHQFGSTGSSWLTRMLKRVFQGKSDDRLTVRRIFTLDEDNFFPRLRHELLNIADAADRSVLVYIHGYNVSFLEAAIRAAQIGFDLKVRGLTAFFSWPSKARLDQYVPDEDTIAASEKSIADFVVSLAKEVNATKVNIIAHSMGNRGLLRALTAATTQAALGGVRFGQIFLAAPDIDVRLFRQLASVYPQISERTTLYVSGKDVPVWCSRKLHDNERTGYCPPVTVVDGIDTVEVTNIDVSCLGHAYFATAADVLSDMFTLLASNTAPEKRFRLRSARTSDGATYWSLAG